MANQCVFRQIHSTGYAYLRQFKEEQEICSKCPCSNRQCAKATNASETGKQLDEALFTNFLMEITDLSPVDLDEALGDMDHQRRLVDHQRYVQRLSSKTRVMVPKKGTPD